MDSSVDTTEIVITTTQRPLVWYTVYCAVMLLCLVVNLKVIYVVFVSPPKGRKRQVLISKLLAQLSLISIGHLAVLILHTGDRVGFINQKGLVISRFMGFLKPTLPCVFFTTMAAIIYDRIGKFQENNGQILESRLLALIWILPVIYGIPSTLMSTQIAVNAKIHNSTEFDEYSRPVPDHNTLTNDVTRFLIFQASVFGYMAYALFKTRLKFNSIIIFTRDSTERYKGKLRNISFLYCHFVGLALFSITMVILFLVRVATSVVVQIKQETVTATENSPDSRLHEWGDLILMIYFTINSIVNLSFLDHDLHLLPGWCHQLVFKQKGQNCEGEDADTCDVSELHESPIHRSVIKIEVMQVNADTNSQLSGKQEERVEKKPVEARKDVELVENEEPGCSAKYKKSVEKVEISERVVLETLV